MNRIIAVNAPAIERKKVFMTGAVPLLVQCPEASVNDIVDNR
jgi:hypothetical protein